jgi:D-lactate dehydrogenase (cytochrome)
VKKIDSPEMMSDYLHDESKRSGTADRIYFPQSEEDVIEILRSQKEQPVTTQGARTGLTAGCVPEGGIVISTARLDQIVDADYSGDAPSVTVQPGVILQKLRAGLKRHSLFFSPDPTEATASLGGMTSCNSSGALSYRYGAVRSHVAAIDVVLADGDKLHLERGAAQQRARDGEFSLITEGGREICGRLPDIKMPRVKKHTAGYFIHPDMDMIDLFIGSEGTLGIITAIKLRLQRLPRHTWGAVAFFNDEQKALRFVRSLRSGVQKGLPAEAIEFFGADALQMLKEAQGSGEALNDVSTLPAQANCAVYTEYISDHRDELLETFHSLADTIETAGGDPACSWGAVTERDLARLKDFRHAAPTCVNARIALTRKDYPQITKLGTDMSVPDDRLLDVFRLYRSGLAEEGFRSATFGHIGNNHLHVNIMPRNMEEYRRGHELYTRWARQIVAMGGSVSAEHGIGKLKVWLLRELYSEEELMSMLHLKDLFDPRRRLNRGNIFGDLIEKR